MLRYICCHLKSIQHEPFDLIPSAALAQNPSPLLFPILLLHLPRSYILILALLSPLLIASAALASLAAFAPALVYALLFLRSEIANAHLFASAFVFYDCPCSDFF
jgi:hypothetical protein